jgi:hypothetical protein
MQIYITPISDKGFISTIYKELNNSATTLQSIKNWAKTDPGKNRKDISSMITYESHKTHKMIVTRFVT